MVTLAGSFGGTTAGLFYGGGGIGSRVGTAYVELVANTKPLEEGFAKAEGMTNAFAGKLNSAGGKISAAGGTLTRNLTLPIVAAGAVATKMASDFETAMERVSALAAIPQSKIASLSKTILDLSGKTATAPTELANSLYFVASAGLKASQIMPVVTQSALGAMTGMGSAADVGKLLVQVLNAYGKAAPTAAQAMNVLTVAVQRGVAEPDELAASLGTVIPVAAQMGVTFQEISGAIAAATDQGINAARAATGLRYMLISLEAPTQVATDALKSYGLNAAEVARNLQQNGLLDTLKMLADRLDLSTVAGRQAFFHILGGVRAGHIALSLVGKDYAQAKEIIDATTQSLNSNAAAIAQAKMRETPGVQFKQMWVDLQKAMIAIGHDLLPMVLDAAHFIEGIAEAFSKLPPATQQWIAKLMVVAAALGPIMKLVGLIAQGMSHVIEFGSRIAQASGAGTAGATLVTAGTETGSAIEAGATAAAATLVAAGEEAGAALAGGGEAGGFLPGVSRFTKGGAFPSLTAEQAAAMAAEQRAAIAAGESAAAGAAGTGFGIGTFEEGLLGGGAMAGGAEALGGIGMAGGLGIAGLAAAGIALATSINNGLADLRNSNADLSAQTMAQSKWYGLTTQQVADFKDKYHSTLGGSKLFGFMDLSPTSSDASKVTEVAQRYNDVIDQLIKQGVPAQQAISRVSAAFHDSLTKVGGLSGNLDKFQQELAFRSGVKGAITPEMAGLESNLSKYTTTATSGPQFTDWLTQMDTSMKDAVASGMKVQDVLTVLNKMVGDGTIQWKQYTALVHGITIPGVPGVSGPMSWPGLQGIGRNLNVLPNNVTLPTLYGGIGLRGDIQQLLATGKGQGQEAAIAGSATALHAAGMSLSTGTQDLIGFALQTKNAAAVTTILNTELASQAKAAVAGAKGLDANAKAAANAALKHHDYAKALQIVAGAQKNMNKGVADTASAYKKGSLAAAEFEASQYKIAPAVLSNKAAFQDWGGSLETTRKLTLDQIKTIGDFINRLYQQGKTLTNNQSNMLRNAIQAGHYAQALRILIRAQDGIHDVKTTVSVETGAAMNALNALLAKLNLTAQGWTATMILNTGGAQGGGHGNANAGKPAGGIGPKGAAGHSGGMATREGYVLLDQNELMVADHPDSIKMMSKALEAAGVGGRGHSIHVHLHGFVGDEKKAADVISKRIALEIRRRERAG